MGAAVGARGREIGMLDQKIVNGLSDKRAPGVGISERSKPVVPVLGIAVFILLVLIGGRGEGKNCLDSPASALRIEVGIDVAQDPRQLLGRGVVAQGDVGEQPVEFRAGGEV